MESVHNKLVFWPYWLLAHQPRIEPVPLALEVQSFNHWTAREVSKFFFLKQWSSIIRKIKYTYITYLN